MLAVKRSQSIPCSHEKDKPMNNPRSLKIVSALIAVLSLALPTVGRSNQIRKEKNEEWKLAESSGFPVWIASNFVIHAPALSHRHIYLLIDGNDFSENNIRTLFTSLAAEFAKPQELFIYAYSERAVLQKKLDKANSGILFSGAFANSPEGRRTSRNSGIRDEPKRSGYYRAEYFRFSDGREQIEYSPQPEQEHVIKIDLRNTIPQYSGDPNKDVVSASERGDLERLDDLIAQGADV
ncbi:MAG TPA: hypothetical protein VNS63_05815, partial [Blastocatellia bacterium]|nr:hypothetical protein [Blastocatellia bacterium]